jgi:FkbM family methyltransferase
LWYRVVNGYFAWHACRFVARTRFGKRIAGDTQEFIELYIYLFGIWEPNFTHWMMSSLSRGDVFIDIGANIGYFSLLASSLVGQAGSVIAIEASPRIFRELQANLRRNQTTNVRALNVAASNVESTVKVFSGPPSAKGFTTIMPDSGLPEESEIPAAPLSTLLDLDEFDRARLIKIDVEGAEGLVVDGLRELLPRARPDLEILIEINPGTLVKQGRRPEDILAALAEEHFRPYVLENDYSATSILSGSRPPLLQPLDQPLAGQADILFSRRSLA